MEPKVRESKKAPPPPTVNDARVAAEENDTLRRRKGRSATFISDGMGRMTGGAAVKNLMGQGAGA